jgi:hypothetical protein
MFRNLTLRRFVSASAYRPANLTAAQRAIESEYVDLNNEETALDSPLDVNNQRVKNASAPVATLRIMQSPREMSPVLVCSTHMYVCI